MVPDEYKKNSEKIDCEFFTNIDNISGIFDKKFTKSNKEHLYLVIKIPLNFNIIVQSKKTKKKII